MGTASRVPDLIDHLLTTWRADATLTAATVSIIDGPYTSDLSDTTILAVGTDLADADSDEGATSQQEQKYIGRATSPTRQEDIEITCTLAILGGTTNMAARRATAYQLFDAACEALRATASAWSAAGRVVYLGVGASKLRQIQSNAGATVLLVFTVQARALI